MNRRMLIVATTGVAVSGFAAAVAMYRPATPTTDAMHDRLVRPHAPVIGPAKAPVTIVEFFDPACESCRAVYPFVKQLLAQYPNDVRLVVRYAPFHDGSDQAVRIIEAARLQDKFLPVMEALLEAQPLWADHHRPDIAKAWAAAGAAGLDLERARKDAVRPQFDEVLRLDGADLRAVGVKATPTFFVNGKPLVTLGRRQLQTLVDEEVREARKKAGR